MKVLLPIDGSPFTQLALEYVAEHEDLLGLKHEYLVMTVVPAIPTYAARFLAQDVVEGYYFDQARDVLETAKWFTAQKGWNIKVTYFVGRAPEIIADLATNENYDLIIMGTHGRSVLKNIILGSVASGVLARCKVPVLLVR